MSIVQQSATARMLRAAMVSAFLSTGCACAHAQETKNQQVMAPTKYSSEDEALYQQRFALAISRSDPSKLYTPMEPIVGASSWTPLPSAEPEDRSIAGWALRAADAYAAANNSSALIVWHKGRIEAERYFGDVNAVDTANSFSLAKPVTALAIGRAIALGKISSLDQPVADLVAEWRDDPVRKKILVRHLLDMRAGFLAQSVSTDPADVMSRSFLHPQSDQIIIEEYPVTHEPGTRYEYNNATSSMVAVLIERATGQRYAEFVGNEILVKIGARGGEVWVNRPGGVAHSGCCMMLPPESFLRIALLTLQDGIWEGQRLLPEGYVAQMRQPTAQNPYHGMGLYVAGTYIERRGWANADIDLPKILHSEPYLAKDLYLFDGNMNQVVYVVPSLDLVILRMGRMPPRNAQTEWDNSFLPNIIMRGIDCANSCPQPQPRQTR